MSPGQKTCTTTIDYAWLVLKDLEAEKSFEPSSESRKSCNSEKRRKKKEKYAFFEGM